MLRRMRTSDVLYVAVLSVCVWFLKSVALAAEPPEKSKARQILQTTGVKGGLIVHLGCGDGRLTAALRANDSYVVHGLDADAANIEKAREHIQSLKLYGEASVEQWTSERLPYADNLVNLFVSEALGDVPMDEVIRVLVPDGCAYLKKGGRWAKTTKPRPKEIDEWTHFLHDAGNNAVAHDAVVGPPRRMQWVAKPLWCRSHEIDSSVSALVSAHGRVFYILDEGLTGITDKRLPQTWSLIARDAFNGVLLWKRPIPHWGWREWKRSVLQGKDWTSLRGQRTRFPSELSRRLVASGDRVFVTLGYRAPLTIIDAATGDIVRECEGTEGCEEILFSDGLLVIRLRKIGSDKAGRRGGKGVPESILAVNADTGKILWIKQQPRCRPLSLAVSDGRCFFHNFRSVVCLDLKTGAKQWQSSNVKGEGVPQTLVVHNGVVLLSYNKSLKALSADTGKTLWSKRAPKLRGAPRLDLFVTNGLIWRGLSGVGRDPLTGEKKRKIAVKNLRSGPHHHRCYRNKATDRYIMSGKEGVEFLDLRSDKHSRDNWVRGACKLGIMPCNGLLYTPPDQCFCEPGVKVNGFCALAPAKERQRVASKRLETGTAYAEIQNLKSKVANKEDWPTYRRDASRSGATRSVVSPKLERFWRIEMGGKVTSPVVSDGRLYFASVDTHTVYAFSSDTGERLWGFTAGGRVDSPPTVYGPLVLFGSADGWLYCLRASDGELAWRFRGAQRELLIGAFGQLESAWPVHGSVLVKDGVVYFAAGRSSFLDGGIYCYGLDPMTGKALCQARVEGPHADLSKGPGQSFYMHGSLPDILVGDGGFVYMRQVKFDSKLVRQETPYITHLGDMKVGLHLFSTAGFVDDSWFNRTFWMYSATWPGFYIANQAPKSGQLLVFDDTTTYGVKCYTRRNRHSPMFFPGTDGYLLFADDNETEPVLVDEERKPKPVKWLPDVNKAVGWGLHGTAVNKDKGTGFTRARPPKWAEWVPVRIRAMVLAGKTLFVAGPPDLLDPKDPLAAFEGRKGATLWAVSAADGKKLAEYKLDSPPIFDGMIAANSRLYVSTRNGEVICFGSEG